MGDQVGFRPIDIKALLFLSQNGGGWRSSTVARWCGELGPKREAVFRHHVMLPLVARGYAELLDREKPALFVITNEGRYALPGARTGRVHILTPSIDAAEAFDAGWLDRHGRITDKGRAALSNPESE